jgi:hypothetical protein
MDINNAISNAAGQMKLCCGVVNNAAWQVCLEAHDHIKKSKQYRNEVKRLFKQALEEFHKYENNLIYTRGVRFFHLDDMAENSRKMYGDISDQEYYDFWASTGATMYYNTRQHVTALQHKYKRVFEAHNLSDADIVAWAMTALTCLKIASVSFNMEKSVVHKNFKLDKRVVDRFFRVFSLEKVEKCWYNALKALNAQSAEEGMTERERKDIGFGIEVLRDEWMDTQKHLRITGEAIDNYQEVFRTKGEVKKALREIADMDNEIEEENMNALKRRIING